MPAHMTPHLLRQAHPHSSRTRALPAAAVAEWRHHTRELSAALAANHQALHTSLRQLRGGAGVTPRHHWEARPPVTQP